MSLENKIIVNFGDSIFGNFRAPEDISSYIAEITGAKTYNVGFGGCRMSVHSLPHFDKFCMYRIADAVTTRDFQPQEDAFDFVPRGEALPTYFRDSFELLRSIDFNTGRLSPRLDVRNEEDKDECGGYPDIRKGGEIKKPFRPMRITVGACRDEIHYEPECREDRHGYLQGGRYPVSHLPNLSIRFLEMFSAMSLLP